MPARRGAGYYLVAALALVLGGALLVWALAAEADREARASPADVPGGDPARGAELLQEYGCTACHVVPGVPGARGLVGPPLNDFALRGYIGGRLINTPENLVAWIRNPQAVDPETAMPNLGVSERNAAHMAAYLYTLD